MFGRTSLGKIVAQVVSWTTHFTMMMHRLRRLWPAKMEGKTSKTTLAQVISWQTCQLALSVCLSVFMLKLLLLRRLVIVAHTLSSQQIKVVLELINTSNKLNWVFPFFSLEITKRKEKKRKWSYFAWKVQICAPQKQEKRTTQVIGLKSNRCIVLVVRPPINLISLSSWSHHHHHRRRPHFFVFQIVPLVFPCSQQQQSNLQANWNSNSSTN